MFLIILMLYLNYLYFLALTRTITFECHAKSLCSSMNFAIGAISSSWYSEENKVWSKRHVFPRLQVSSVSAKCAQYFFFNVPGKWILLSVLWIMDPVNSGRLLLLYLLLFTTLLLLWFSLLLLLLPFPLLLSLLICLLS